MIQNFSAGRKILLVFALFSVLLLLAAAILAHTTARLASSGTNVGRALAPLSFAASRIALDGTLAHLKMEEIMGGDAAEDISEVTDALDAAEAYARLILDGGHVDDRLFIASASPEVRAEIATVLKGLEAFRAAAISRYALLGGDNGVGTSADAEFDGLFDQIVNQIESAAATVGDDASAQALAGAARFDLALGHLLVEEVLAGDATEDFNGALAQFDSAAVALETLGERVPQLSSRLAPLLKDIVRFGELAVQRRDNAIDNAKRMEAAEVSFDATYTALTDASSRAEAEVNDAMTEGLSAVDRASWLALVVALVAMVILTVSILVSYRWLDRVLGKRLTELCAVMQRLTAGDLNAAAPDWRSTDEVGVLRDAVDGLKQALERQRRLEHEGQAERAATEAERRKAEAGRVEADAARADAEAGRAAASARAAEARGFAQDFAVVVARSAEGRFDARIANSYGDPELSRLAAGVNGLMDEVERGLGAAAHAIAGLAEGDLSCRMEGDFSGDFLKLKRDVNATIEKLADTVMQIDATAGAIVGDARSIRSDSQGLADRTTSQAATLEQTVAAITQFSHRVQSNTKAAETVAERAQNAAGLARDGGKVVGEAVSAMGQIGTSSQQVKEIVRVIDDISFQTNLLALNAGVEAARAGEAGRGFAVVAQEVRVLAQRATEAAKNIDSLIEASGRDVAEGVRLVQATGEVLSSIVKAIDEVAETTNGITQKSREQSASVSEISSAVADMDRITQDNAAMADGSARSSRLLTEQAEQLETLMGFFRGGTPAAQAMVA